MKTDNVFVLARRIRAALIIIITSNAFPPQIFRYSLPCTMYDEIYVHTFHLFLLVHMYVLVSHRPSKNAIKCSNIIF